MSAQCQESPALYTGSQMGKAVCFWIMEPGRDLRNAGSMISQTFQEVVSQT